MDQAAAAHTTESQSAETIAVWGFMAFFAILFVAPVILESCWRTGTTSGAGRIGFLTPAVILADSSNRLQLTKTLVATALAIGFAIALGRTLGLFSVCVRSRFGRMCRFATFLPGAGPAWLFPVLVGTAGGLGAIRETENQTRLLIAWFLWTTWWGALRIGAAIHAASTHVTSAEWDVSRTLGGSAPASLRMILRPRLRRIVRDESKTVAAVSLFDPTPVLFWGLDDLPIARVVAAMRSTDVHRFAEAAGWICWLAAAWTLCAAMVRLIWRSGGPDSFGSIAAPNSAGRHRAFADLPGLGGWLVFGLWPWAVVGAFWASVAKRSEIAGAFSAVVSGAWSDAGVRESYLLGLVISAAVGLAAATACRFVDIRKPARTCFMAAVRWPLAATVCALAIRAESGGVSLGLVESMFSGDLGMLGWAFALTIFAMSSMNRFQNVSSPSADRLPSQEAGREAALSIGISAPLADRLSSPGRAERQSWRVGLSVALASWWVWASPAWTIAPVFALSAVPFWGQTVVRQAQQFADGPEGIVLAIVTLAPAAVVMIWSAAGRLIDQAKIR